jgi:hypothetical protein
MLSKFFTSLTSDWNASSWPIWLYAALWALLLGLWFVSRFRATIERRRKAIEREGINEPFYIDPHNMGATLRYIDGMVREHLKRAEQLINSNQLTESLSRHVRYRREELEKSLAEFSNQPGRERFEKVTFSLKQLESTLDSYEELCSSPSYTRLKQDYDTLLVEFQRRIKEIRKDFPQPWYGWESPKLSWVPPLRNKEELRSAIKRLQQMLDEVIPEVVEKLEQMKKQDAFRWH